jgi:ABC-2 type transport system ATP-binding protein
MIETRGLTRVFKRNKLAVDRVDLCVQAGTIYGLIGPNRAGKSTLVAMLCTLLVPSSGSAEVAGHDVWREPREVRRAISLNFGGERAFYYRLTLEQNLEFFAGLHGLNQRQTTQRMTEALERIELWHERGIRYAECSTGMKKRLNFARALMLDAPLYICDEPTTGVDVDSSLRMRGILREMREQGRTLLLVSHNLEEVGALADRVGLMHQGRLIHEDTPEGFRSLVAPREISLEFVGDVERRFLDDLRTLPDVHGIDRLDGRVLLRTANPERTIAHVIDLVRQRQVPVSGVQVVRPDLAEVFRYLVGSTVEG